MEFVVVRLYMPQSHGTHMMGRDLSWPSVSLLPTVSFRILSLPNTKTVFFFCKKVFL